MDALMQNILTMQGIIWIGVLFILIYLVIRRLGIKQNEEFEDRDN